MAKINTQFMTKMAENHTLWGKHTYIAHIREYSLLRGKTWLFKPSALVIRPTHLPQELIGPLIKKYNLKLYLSENHFVMF